VIWPVVRRKLDLLNRVDRLDALRVPPGNRLEALRGSRAGSFGIRVNDQYRLTFRFKARISDLVVVLSPAEQASRLDFPGRGREEPRHKG
jgi:plasmid maintenance system killer protein